MGRRSAIAVVMLASLFQTGVAAAADGAHWAVVLRGQLARANAVDYRLATSLAPLCAQRAAASGIVLDTVLAYPQRLRSDVARTLALGEAPVVAAVAPGSAAERAGLQVGDEVRAIAGTQVDFLLDRSPEALPVTVQLDEALAALPTDRASAIAIRRDGRDTVLALRPEPRCAVMTAVATSTKVDAYGDGKAIALTTGLIAFTRSDDELAMVAGHEFAHTLLRARPAVMQLSSKRREDAADLVGARIAQCAGYDMAGALGFWTRFAKAKGLMGLSLTHRGGGKRKRQLEAALGTTDCANVLAGIP